MSGKKRIPIIKSNKIAVFGNFGSQNWGNEGTLEATLYNIRRFLGDVEIICICTEPQDVISRYGISAFPAKTPQGKYLRGRNNLIIKLVRKLFFGIPRELVHWYSGLRILMTTKAMIVPGTGLLSDFGTGSLGLPYAIFKWSLLSKLCRNKLLFVSNGAGPIREGLTGWFIKSSMRMADYRSFRSEYARNYLEKVGFDSSKDPIFPDLAFSLPQRIFTLKEKAPGGGYAVGVGLMDYYGEHGIRENGQKVYANYVTVMCNFIKWLLDRNYEVRILLGDTKHDDHVKEDVLTIMGNMGLEFNPEKIFDGSVSSVGELLSQISDVDYVVSPRFHNIIFGLMYDKPVVSLAYHPKFSSLMEEFGIAEYCHPLDHLDLDKLIMQFKMLVREKEKLIFLGKKKRDDYRADLEKQYSYILSRKFIN